MTMGSCSKLLVVWPGEAPRWTRTIIIGHLKRSSWLLDSDLLDDMKYTETSLVQPDQSQEGLTSARTA